FPYFANLPPELRRQIWEATRPRPGLHVVDVCIPSSLRQDRLSRAFRARDGDIRDEARYNKFKGSAFLDVLEVTPSPSTERAEEIQASARGCNYTFDPSLYRAEAAVQATCLEAADTLRTKGKKSRAWRDGSNGEPYSDKGVNSIYLPSRDKWIHYDNACDVLFLHFGAPASISDLMHEALLGDHPDPDHPDYLAVDSGISDALECSVWSPELAQTLHHARKLAIDVTETWPSSNPQLVFEEVAMFACCIRNDLEVLYLVDHCVGRCQNCTKGGLDISSLQSAGELAKQLSLSDEERTAEVIYGAGLTYREVLDLEKLGWNED
ncbi:hypothetical protein GQ53DRAFT_588550, partial [Thozetella sp. PMI_491]